MRTLKTRCASKNTPESCEALDLDCGYYSFKECRWGCDLHEPFVEALPGLVGAVSAVGGLGGMVAVAGANLRKRMQARRELEVPFSEETPQETSAVS